MEAQRFPDDYDGILAGAPANNWTRLLTSALWSMQATGNDPESYIPAAKWKAVEAAVNNACDASDGVKDGILNDPRQCHFDPAAIECKAGADSSACLTAKQVVTLKKIYEGPHDSRGGSVFFGLLPGAESRASGWESWVSGEALGKSIGFFFGKEYFTNFVYQDKTWDYRTANLEASSRAADERTASALNATGPDLSAFERRSGKLILFHGWNDPAIPATGTVDYVENVQKQMGAGAAERFLRLYMVPGMQHCGGGPGTSLIGGNQAPFEADRNVYSSLEQWVEKGVAPGPIVASKAGSTMTRPICPYPQAAKYKGTGDTNDAANFACVK
jgi:feruloyl esterase